MRHGGKSRKTVLMSAAKRHARTIAWTEHYRRDLNKSNLSLIEKTARIRRTKVARVYAGEAADGGAKRAAAAVKQRVQAARKAPAYKK
jgi:hypothetical protein